MEATGLAIGVAGLSGLFNSAVDSYGYVCLGRNYATDFQTSQTKLDLSRLRLSRWGEALRLTAPIAETTHLPSSLGNEAKEAERALGNILHLLGNAQHKSESYKARASRHSLLTLDPDDARLHQKVQRIISQRQRNTSFMKKTAWALYEKKDLDRLVEDIADMTNQLVNLFPATQPMQQELSVRELHDFGDEHLPLIKDIAGTQDPLLASEAQKAMQACGSVYNQPTTRGGAAGHYGIRVHSGYQGPLSGMSNTYNQPLAEGEGTQQHCGHVFGG